MFLPLLLPLLAGVNAQVAKSWSNVKATAYYDLEKMPICTHPNGGPWPNNWWDTINGGYTACQKDGTTRYTLNSLGSNRIVAMDLNADGRGPEYWCGKEVQIFRPDGTQIVLDEGPFVVYDNCGACGGGAIIDVSAKAFVQISNGKCGDNPTGLTLRVMDRAVVASGRPGGGAAAVTSTAAKFSSTTAKSSTTTTKPTTIAKSSTTAKSSTKTTATSTVKAQTSSATKTTTKITPAATKPAKSTTKSSTTKSSTTKSSTTKTSTTKTSTTTSRTSSTPARNTTPATLPADPNNNYIVGITTACTMGKYVCDGRVLKICNYVTWDALGWVEITTCPSRCVFKGAQLECV